jgi:hypothetical protein
MTDSNDPIRFEDRLLVSLLELDQRTPRSAPAALTRVLRRRPLMLAVAGAVVVAVGGATAAVAALTGQATSFAAAAHSVVAGETMTVKGTGCQAGSDVRFSTPGGRELGQAIADADGSFVTAIAVPADVATGDLTIAASCPNGSASGLVQHVVVVVVPREPLAAALAVVGSATPGGQVGVKGAGCRPGAEVTFTIARSSTLGSTTAGSDGGYVTTLTVPSTAAIGHYAMTAECARPNGTDLRMTADLVVE